MGNSKRLLSHGLGLVGGVAGGIFGHVLFGWFLKYGFYAMIFPGAFVGIGCGLLARHVSQARGAICAIVGLIVGLQTEWAFFPFERDESFAYFLKHIGQLTPVTQAMIVIGALMAFWFGKEAGFDLGMKRFRRSRQPRLPE